MTSKLEEITAMQTHHIEEDCERLRSELKTLLNRAEADDRPFTAGEDQRCDSLTKAITLREAVIAEQTAKTLEARQAIKDRFALAPDQDSTKAGVILNTGRPSPNQNRSRIDGPDADRGRSAINDAFRSGDLPDHAAAKATALVERGHEGERSLAGRWAAAAGNADYRGAFAKMLADPTHGHQLWTPKEQEAFRAVATVDAEMRAMSTTAGNGGYMIPLTLDPAILLTNSGSINPLRELATVKQTMTNKWTGVTSAGASSEWKTEAAEAADGSPTLGNPSIDVHLGDSFVPYSYEVGQDAVDFLAELSSVLTDSADQLQATAYTTGTGSGQPEGIVTGLVGTASEINAASAETFTAADLYALQNALPARFSNGATWQSHIAIGNMVRQFETTSGAHEFPELREMPAHILGKRWYENSGIDGTFDPAVTANNYVALYGDVAKAFYIVDRVGSTLELIPNLVGANQRPTGQRGALLWFRTGSAVVVPEAMRMLDIPTTA
jgi:HK97 family phage major capsid protein